MIFVKCYSFDLLGQQAGFRHCELQYALMGENMEGTLKVYVGHRLVSAEV